jgi:propionyl-CoA carboxylase alpha chain
MFRTFHSKTVTFVRSQHNVKKPLFDKILIANRGEIACRIISTCKKLGIKTVAVWSDADENAKHVKMADEAYYIGPPTVSESYNKIDNILKACLDTKAQAVHPGFGFLSENALFQKALNDNGIIFCGPDSPSIAAMGDKLTSKRIAKDAKVNCIPGYDGNIETAEKAKEVAHQLGYPVMVKAAHGGGGKGMRVCYNDAELIEGFKLSKLEAARNFSSDAMLVEKFIEEPRHIEIQVLCDRHGNAVFLNERECSIQRRNQKVIEEAPSCVLDPKTRKAMGEQAIRLARAVKYVSAGTVEMLVDKNKNFYFLEMNTRLQVEHPVTEMTTGIDIVEQMIRVAAGLTLPFKQEDIPILGHATECRVYAEDPMNNFAPSIGTLERYVEPLDENGHIRCDSGILEGTEISVYYDPMISKLIAWGKTREESRLRMIEALDKYIITGVKHNISLLRSVLEHPKYIDGKFTTKFLQETYPDGFKGITVEKRHKDILICSTAIAQFMTNQRAFSVATVSVPNNETYKLTFGEEKKDVKITDNNGTFTIEYDEEKFDVKSLWKVRTTIFELVFRGETVILQVIEKTPTGFILQFMGTRFEVHCLTSAIAELNKYMPIKPKEDFSKFLLSPMPGVVVQVSVKVGDKVLPNQELCVIEAMKMQNMLRAKGEGIVKAVNNKPGDIVSGGTKLIEFE